VSADIHSVRVDCQELIARFYRYLDSHDYEPLSLMFAPEGVWSRQGKQLQGPGGVLEELRRRPATMVTRHVVSNQIVEIQDAQRVRMQCYVTLYYADTGTLPQGPSRMTGPACVFTYYDELIATDGGWRIARKWSSMDFSAV
jgi:hypothetical protein